MSTSDGPSPRRLRCSACGSLGQPTPDALAAATERIKELEERVAKVQTLMAEKETHVLIADLERALDSAGATEGPLDGRRDAIAFAIHDVECGDHHCEPHVMGRFFRLADAVLAALPTSDAVPLCGQCGERLAVMRKIGTGDPWCSLCLDQAADSVGATEGEATCACGQPWCTAIHEALE